MKGIVPILQTCHWSFIVSLVLGLAAFFHVGIAFFYNIFSAKFMQQKKRVGLFVLNILYGPFRLFLWCSAITFLLTIYLESFFDQTLVHPLMGILKVGIVCTISWSLYILSKEGERILLEKWHQELTIVQFLSKISFLSIILMTILLVLPIFHLPIQGILAFGGFGGIIVGFASKDVLSNILGGLLLAVDRPFKIGEWIRSIDGKMDGIVEAIGWKATKVRTLEKQILYIPNSFFSSISFINRSRSSHFRMVKGVSIRMEDRKKVETLIKKIYQYLEKQSALDHRELCLVHVKHISTFSLDLEVIAYLKKTEYKKSCEMAEKILLEIYQIIESENVHIATPLQTVQLL